jgi:hypothetical protein
MAAALPATVQEAVQRFALHEAAGQHLGVRRRDQQVYRGDEALGAGETDSQSGSPGDGAGHDGRGGTPHRLTLRAVPANDGGSHPDIAWSGMVS